MRMQMTQVYGSVVRVLDSSEKTTGTGFLVANGLVVTCAHVVRMAGGSRGSEVNLEFHSPEPASRETIAAKVEPAYWRDEAAEDVAVLRLTSQPHSARPFALATSAGTSGQDFYTYGFPAAKPMDGLPGEVRVTGETSEGGYPVLAVRSNEISVGFSGAPVWDPKSRAVIGMVVSTVPARLDPMGKQSDVSFIRPIEVIRAVCEELRLSGECPYRGLEVFEAEHATQYVGREAAIYHLLRLLSSRDFVAVIGVSGSGKSSLVRAGLHKGLMTTHWIGLSERRRCAFRPGSSPLLALATAVDDRLSAGSQQPATSREIVAAATRAACKADLLVVVDQFEQIYTEGITESEADEFINLLLDLANDSVKVVITLRADFYGNVLSHPRLAKAVEHGLYTLLQMTDEELSRAVTDPAAQRHRSFEDGLVERIVADVAGRPGDLPMLEFALTELWHRDQQTGILTMASYESLGGVGVDGHPTPGVRGAILTHAEKTLQALDEDQQADARQLFLSLVTSGASLQDRTKEATSRRAWQAEWSDSVQRLAQRLAAEDIRLLVAGYDPATGQSTYELAHEALVHAWPRLHSWVRQYEPFIRWYTNDLSPLLRRWLDQGRLQDYLMPRAMLGDAERWLAAYANELTGPATEFITESVTLSRYLQDREQRERALLQAALEDVKHQRTIAVSRQLAAEAELFYNRPSQVVKGLLLAVEAMRLRQGLEADLAIRHGLDKLAGWAELRVDEDTDPAGEHFHPEMEYWSRGWSVDSRRKVFENTFSVVPRGVSLSSDATLLAAADDTVVRVWRISDYQMLFARRHAGWISDLSFDLEGLRLAAVGADLRIWSIPDGNEIRRWDTPGFRVRWNGSGKTVAALDINRLRVWDTRSYELIQENEYDLGRTVYSLALSADCTRIAAGYTSEARVFDVVTGQKIETVYPGDYLASGADAQHVTSVDLSPDGSMLATGVDDPDGTVDVWDVAQSQAARTILTAPLGGIPRVRFASNRLLATLSRNILRVWSLPEGQLLRIGDFPGVLEASSTSPSGSLTATVAQGAGVRIWRTGRGHEVLQLRHGDDATSVEISSGGALVATGGADGYARVWDSAGSKILKTRVHSWSHGGHAGTHNVAVRFIDEGRSLFISAADRAEIWDMENRVEVRSFKPRTAVSDDGTRLIRLDSNSSGATVVAHTQEGETVTSFSLPATAWLHTFTRNTDAVAFIEDDAVQIWQISDGRLAAELHPEISPYNLSFSPDGKQLAVWNKRNFIELWRWRDQYRIGRFETTGKISNAVFSPDGTHLVMAIEDAAVVWSLSDGRPVARVDMPRTVRSVAFSSDQRLLGVAAADGSVVASWWQAEDLVSEALHRVNRRLSVEERRQHLPDDMFAEG